MIVTTIMPVYNGERFIEEALYSIVNQTYNNQEILIINDASTDSTNQILADFCKRDYRIRVIRNPKRLKVAKSLNIGLKQARGDLVARIDADDIWMPDKIEQQVNAFQNDSSLGLLGTAKFIINEDGRIINRRNYFPYFKDEDIRLNIHKANLFTHSSVMFRYSLIERFGLYDERFLNSEDYEYWLRVTSKVKVGIISKPLVKYRLHSESVTTKRIQQQMYFSIKARVRYFKDYGYRGFLSKFFLKEVFQLFFPYPLDSLILNVKTSICRLRKRF